MTVVHNYFYIKRQNEQQTPLLKMYDTCIHCKYFNPQMSPTTAVRDNLIKQFSDPFYTESGDRMFLQNNDTCLPQPHRATAKKMAMLIRKYY